MRNKREILIIICFLLVMLLTLFVLDVMQGKANAAQLDGLAAVLKGGGANG